MTDFSRYSRQVVLREIGVNGQSLLRDSTVLVIGLGGLGSVAALYLAGPDSSFVTGANIDINGGMFFS